MSDWNEAIEAEASIEGNKFRNTLVEKADAHNGPYPLWHGWAIMAAFLAGAKYGRSLKRPAPLDGGWALVPREPTVEMIDSSCAAWWKLHPAFPGEKSEPTAGDTVAAIYRAMLAAAPSPEKAEGER